MGAEDPGAVGVGKLAPEDAQGRQYLAGGGAGVGKRRVEGKAHELDPWRQPEARAGALAA